MRFSQRAAIAAVIVLASALQARPAPAHGYTGTWPVTVKDSQRSNGTGCLTLNGNSSYGSASLVFGSQKYTYGSYFVLNGLFIATISQPLYGQNGALMFIAPSSRGHFEKGDFEDIEGGSNFDLGDLKFGMKNGC